MSGKQEAHVLTERREGTLIVTLNRPERRNAIGPEITDGLQAAFEAQESDPSIRAVVLTGAGPSFCAGGDISRQGLGRGAKRAQFAVSRKIALQISGASVPVISAVEGWAAGAGFGLALLADTVVVSEETGFMPSWPKLGVMPDYGALETLPRRVGLGKARQIFLYARAVKGPEALALGIADEMVAPGKTLERALDIAGQVEALAPRALRAIKDYYAETLNKALDYEFRIQPELLLSEDAAEGRAAFAEKRAPKFKDA